MSTRKRYENAQAHPRHGLVDVLRWRLGLGPRDPASPLRNAAELRPGQARPLSRRDQTEAEPIQLTWIGHSTFLIQYLGCNILTDPIFGNCLPLLPLARLRRVAPPGLPLDSLPKIEHVLISHCHYDHLDAAAVKNLAARHAPSFWVPAGLAPWFRLRNLQRCAELDWWNSISLGGGIQLDCVPAQHFAARGLFDRNHTHWCGWVLRGASRSIYFAGDTGYCPVFREIGERFAGFDLAVIPIGAYRPRWLMQPMHVNPEEAVQIHLDVRSRQSVACHWGTFALTDEPLSEPPELLKDALRARGLPLEDFLVLRPGKTIQI